MTPSTSSDKGRRRRSYDLTDEACEVLANASVRLKQYPSDLVSESIVSHLSEKIRDMPHKKGGL